MVRVKLERRSLVVVSSWSCSMVRSASVSASLLKANLWAVIERRDGGGRLQGSSCIGRVAI